MSFRERVQKSEIKPPNKPGFTIEKWNLAYENTTNPTNDDKMLFESGVVFFKIFENIRKSLECLNNNIPKLTNENIIRLHFAQSNLDYKKMDDRLKSSPKEVFNIFLPQMFELYGGAVKIPPQDLADGIVDSIHYATLLRCSDLKHKNKSNGKIDVKEFIAINTLLSHTYYLVEEYWQGIMWGGYISLLLENKMTIKQIESNENVGYLVSLNRKMKLESNDSVFNNNVYLGKRKVVCYKSEGGGDIVLKNLSSLEKIEIDTYNSMNYKAFKLRSDFPKDFIYKEINSLEFTIDNVLDVFIHLVVFSRDVYKSLNEVSDRSKNIIDACPVFKVSKLAKKLEVALDIKYEKVLNIIKFLSFENKKDNLWSQPIVKLNNNYLTILLSSIVAPNIGRLIEYWLKKAFDDISKKGISYENKIIDSVNTNLEMKSIFSDHDSAINRKFKVKDIEEEIDCIFRFGKIVVVCEAKCIITVDSEVSKFNTLKSIKKAAKQVKRKAGFIKDNLESIFTIANWYFDSKLDYKVVPLIINSNRIFCGTTIDDIPVVDEILLSAFFSRKIVPLLSINAEEHIAWFELYKSFEEAQELFESYLKNPPQIALDSRYIENQSLYPFKNIINIGVDIEVISLSLKKYNLDDIMEARYLFPIKKSRDYNDKISQLNLLI